MSVVRLRPVPAIAFEPEEGLRLRRSSGEAGLDQVQGASDSGPHRPWSSDLYDLQMRAKVAVTLVEECHRNVLAMSELLDTNLLDHIGLEQLSFQVHELKRFAEELQPN
jgi:hypothetical protein